MLPNILCYANTKAFLFTVLWSGWQINITKSYTIKLLELTKIWNFNMLTFTNKLMFKN